MLTSSNPVLNKQGALVKLIDFGFASKVNDSMELAGTPSYASPELAKAFLTRKPSLDREYNCKSADVYALGVTFYALLSASMPYDHEDKSKLLHLILATPYSIPPSIKTHY